MGSIEIGSIRMGSIEERPNENPAVQWQGHARGDWAHARLCDLIDAAHHLPVPENPPLKDPKNFTLIGKPLKRFYTPDEANGRVIYGIMPWCPE